MPRPSKGVRLYKRKARYRRGKLVHQAVWIIKDGDRHIATGCVASPSETKPPTEAEQALANYIAQKYQPERRRQDIEDIDCADVLSTYLTDIGEPVYRSGGHSRHALFTVVSPNSLRYRCGVSQRERQVTRPLPRIGMTTSGRSRPRSSHK
jgi:hypothetical protein